jgi:undecaprenyl-diphosphatase
MNWIEALVLGIIQGVTEFLPISSSGHIEIGKALFGLELEDNLTFDIVVHAATVCSTIVVFRKDILHLLSHLFRFEWNDETQYISKLVLSALPVVLIGLFLGKYVEAIFKMNSILILVAFMLLVTAVLLVFTYYAKPRDKKISYVDALIIGIAQAIAVLPGLSRSGSTIATALFLKNKRDEAAKFSFLMVLLPIAGKAILDLMGGEMTSKQIAPISLLIGFISSFVVGLLACRFMIVIVKKSKLIYFAIYCAVVALFAMILG